MFWPGVMDFGVVSRVRQMSRVNRENGQTL
jgi:hypothetical protein